MRLPVLFALHALAAFVALASPAYADNPSDDAAQEVQTERNFCFSVCKRRLAGCTITHSASEATCDAGYLGCATGCSACMPKFESCVRAGTTATKCQDPLFACLKEESSRKTGQDPVKFEGGDGISQTAAVVVFAKTAPEGILAEDLWVLKHHDTWRRKGQSPVKDGDRLFDRIDYDTPEGARQLWFDVSRVGRT